MNDFLPELISLAESRGFERIAQTLPALDERLAIPNAPILDVEAPPGADVPSLLGQMVRRGLQRPLVEALLERFAGRALESALIAWDALVASVIPDWEGNYIAALRGKAEAARAVLPPPGELGIRTDVAYDELMQRLSPAALKGASVDVLLDAVGNHDIGAYEALRTRSGATVDALRTAGVLTDLRNFSKLLSLAHLPTLASFYARYAWIALRETAARDDLVEILSDADAFDRLPRELFSASGEPVDELAVYATLRSLIARGASDTAFGLLGERCGRGRRPIADELGDSLAVVYSELSVDIGETNVAPERLARITSTSRLWRYALRVTATNALRLAPSDSSLPMQAVETFLAGFGNDYHFWRAVIVGSSMDQPWFPSAVGLLLRETVALPHSRACWSALEYLLDPTVIDFESAARVRVQSNL
jgi:hypothetical protein